LIRHHHDQIYEVKILKKKAVERLSGTGRMPPPTMLARGSEIEILHQSSAVTTV
jgi:hypothetical protein